MVSAGYEAKIVDNGATALSACREFRPHLLVSEIELPKIDGHHLFREVKAHSSTRNIPFILMSRHRSVEERVHSINLGVEDYITTPFNVDEVVLRFEIILNEIERLEATPVRSSKGFSGKLSDMNLVELLQTLEIGKKTGIIHLQHDNDDGMVFVRDGEAIDASVGNLNAEHALLRMFTWSDGAFRIEFENIEQTRTIKESTSALVRQGFIFRDRWDKVAQNLPPLQATVEATPKLGKVEYPKEERSLLNSINGRSRIIDVIKGCHLDDLKALQIISKLYYQGSLREVSLDRKAGSKSETMEKDRTRVMQNEDNLSNIIVNFLNQNGVTANGRTERRHAQRRLVDRRSHSRRMADAILEGNKVHLTKSELIMIREKLSNGKNAIVMSQ